MDIDKDLASILIRKQNAGKGAEFPGGSLRSRLGGRRLASQSVIQLKLLLTSSYVEM